LGRSIPRASFGVINEKNGKLILPPPKWIDYCDRPMTLVSRGVQRTVFALSDFLRSVVECLDFPMKGTLALLSPLSSRTGPTPLSRKCCSWGWNNRHGMRTYRCVLPWWRRESYEKFLLDYQILLRRVLRHLCRRVLALLQHHQHQLKFLPPPAQPVYCQPPLWAPR